MNPQKQHKVAAFALFFACLISLLLGILAMYGYPGGTRLDHTSVGYSLFSNTYSDLGRWRSYSEEVEGGVSFYLFTAGMLLFGLAVAGHFAFWWQLFLTSKATKVLAVLGSISGVLAGCCYVGIGLTPYDLAPAPHMKFVFVGFSCLSFMSILYGFALILNHEYPRKYAYCMIALAVCSVAYVGLIFLGPGLSTEEGLTIQVTGQKIIIYMQVLSLAFVSHGVVRSRNAKFPSR